MNEDFDALDALAAAKDSRRHLADRLVTPLWYYPAMGLTLVVFAYAIGTPEGTLEKSTRMSLLCGTILINTMALPFAYQRQTGVRIQQATGPRSRRLLLTWLISILVFAVGLVVNRYASGPTWVALALGAVGFVGTQVLGRRYDDAVRVDLREGGLR